MSQSIARINGVDLCVEDFGERGGPTILLISGASSSMDWWDAELCARIAAAGRRVIRYDLRDVGASTSYPPGEPGYSGDDLIDDAVALIRQLRLAPVHLMGVSMGAGIATQVAIRHPELLASLTLFSASPAGPGDADNGLPGVAPRLAAYFAAASPVPDWGDPNSVGDHFVAAEIAFSGSIPVDVERVRAIAATVRARTASPASADNHMIAAGGGEPRARLSEITARTLVIHGTEDPLFPLAHAQALVREVPGARLLTIRGMGHQYPPRSTWDGIIPALLAHTYA